MRRQQGPRVSVPDASCWLSCGVEPTMGPHRVAHSTRTNRREDVVRRKNTHAILTHERESAIKAEEDRCTKRDDEMNAEKAVSTKYFIFVTEPKLIMYF